MILATPLNNKETPPKDIAINIGGLGRSAMSKIEKAIAKDPNAILLKRDVEVLR